MSNSDPRLQGYNSRHLSTAGYDGYGSKPLLTVFVQIVQEVGSAQLRLPAC